MENEVVWVNTGTAILEAALSRGIPPGKISVIVGNSTAYSSPYTKLYEANIATINGRIVKDRTGPPEESIIPDNFNGLKIVYWDPELRLLELESSDK